MEKQQLEQLRKKDKHQISTVLIEFNKKHENLFNFSKLYENIQWHSLWRVVFELLSDDELASLHPLCLNTIRILTRDEQILNKHVIGSEVNKLFKLANLANDTLTDALTPVTNRETVVEALKCLCNLVFQNTECRRLCILNNICDTIVKRVATYIQHEIDSCAMLLHDMKLLFLITALEPSSRNSVLIDCNGVTYLTEWLHEKLLTEPENLSAEKTDVIIEMLKVLFNLTCSGCANNSADKSPMHNDHEIQSLHLINVLCDLFLRFGKMHNEQERHLIKHAINLVSNLPSSCLCELLLQGRHLVEKDLPSAVIMFEGHNVQIIEILLRYLNDMLQYQENETAFYENISPDLKVLVKCVRAHRVMRHFIRSIVLPPLRNVSKRPEEGKELRNYLCRFLTSPYTVVRDLSAELLFVCCKENVSRMIKYTGYGNAAGLFAKRGVLDCRSVENLEKEYSSDSEDSDTEEYKEVQNDINPVIGCYETPKGNPLEGMSEERKEHEAVQLANLIDRLHRTGVMQPCRIGEDGKPQPVDHILQLQVELPQQQLEQKRKT